MNRKISRLRTLRESSAHKHSPAAMKPGLSYPHRRHLRATLALPAAALLLASCEPPASPLTAASSSPSPGAPSAPPPAALEVPTISGLPNMAQIEQRLNAQYAQSAQSTDGVEFDPPSISGTTLSASITYAEGKLLDMKIGGTKHDIKTITITREVDGKTIPTTVEYKDDSGTTRKTITSRYVHPPNITANNARQSLEGGPRLAEAEAEGGRTLHISGEERDGADKILHYFTATERTGGGTTTLRTTYRRPDNEDFTKTVTTENGRLTQKVVTYSAGATPAKDRTPPAEDETKTETITYEKSEESLFYPAKAKRQRAVAVYKDAGGATTKIIETTPTAGGGSLAVHKKPDGTVINSEETTTKNGVTEAVHKDADGNKTKSVETTTKNGVTVAVHKDADGKEISRVETKKDGSTITTTPTAEGSARELVIHSSVTKIGAWAFYDNQLTSVVIPPSVTLIGDYAFYDNQLTSLTIGNGVEAGKIGYEAFAKNPKLKTVRITGTGPVESNAFTYKYSSGPRKGIFVPSGSSGIELIIEDRITAIGEDAFRNSKLTSLTIGNGVHTIGHAAFMENQLTSLTIGNGVHTIEGNAFYENQLTSLTIGDGVQTIGNYAFWKNQLTSLTIGNSVKTIGSRAFSSSKLTSVTIPPSVTSIEDAAFMENQLTSLTIPPSVTAIGSFAFSHNQLTSLTIGNGVQTIGAWAFSGNPKLKTVRITGTGPIESNAFTYLDTSGSRKGIFNESGSWKIELIIEDGITTIGDNAFRNNQLTSLTIGNGVKTIGRGAFWENQLTSLTIGNGVKTIGRGAFWENRLTSLTIGNGVKTIGRDAFSGNQLTSLTIPPSVTAIGEGAFSGNQLTLVILPKALYRARGDAFNGNPADGNPADLHFRDHKGRDLGTN